MSMSMPIAFRSLTMICALSGHGDVLHVERTVRWVALANPTSRDLFAARMGCELYQPEYGIDPAALRIRR